MFIKNVTITDWKNIANFKSAILIGSRLYSPLMSNKQKGKRNGRKTKGLFYVKASSFRNISHRTTRKSSFGTVLDPILREYWTGNARAI